MRAVPSRRWRRGEDQHAQSSTGKTNKTSNGGVTITFPNPFKNVPTVVVTPHWENAHNQVDHIDTVDSITLTNFVVHSKNYAPNNYFVQWIAISNNG